MTKARNIANIASDGSALADGTINYTDVSGTPTLATVATSGAYADVTGTPTLAAVATSGSFNDLSNQPSPFDPNTLATVATTGAYADVTGTPTLGTAAATNTTAYATAAQGTLADSATQPGDLATVATTGAYADVTGTPTLATVATTGAYGDLSGTPAAALPLAGGAMTGPITTNSTFDGRDVSVDGTKLDTIATNANYITNNNQLTNGSSFAVTSDARFTDARQCNNTFNDPTTSRANIGLGPTNGVTFGTVAATSYTGSGASLTGVGAPTDGTSVGSTRLLGSHLNGNLAPLATTAGSNLHYFVDRLSNVLLIQEYGPQVYNTAVSASGTWRNTSISDISYNGNQYTLCPTALFVRIA